MSLYNWKWDTIISNLPHVIEYIKLYRLLNYVFYELLRVKFNKIH